MTIDPTQRLNDFLVGGDIYIKKISSLARAGLNLCFFLNCGETKARILVNICCKKTRYLDKDLWSSFNILKTKDFFSYLSNYLYKIEQHFSVNIRHILEKCLKFFSISDWWKKRSYFLFCFIIWIQFKLEAENSNKKVF